MHELSLKSDILYTLYQKQYHNIPVTLPHFDPAMNFSIYSVQSFGTQSAYHHTSDEVYGENMVQIEVYR
jgi:dolichyl-phosphate-mannose--protein O-mannosyl transferase